MTIEVMIYLMNNLRLYNVSILRFFFYQNQFINEYASKKRAKISESRSPKVFLVSYRRAYVLNKRQPYTIFKQKNIHWMYGKVVIFC